MTQTQIKICGLSTSETIDAAARAGATHIGLVHFDKSPRHVSLEQAASLRAQTPPHVKVVLLLVNAEPGSTAQAFESASNLMSSSSTAPRRPNGWRWSNSICGSKSGKHWGLVTGKR
jgi:hypothetical protein